MKKLLNTLYINSTDRYLSLDGENVVVLYKNEVVGRVPLHNLDRIMTFGYTGASPALIGKCAENNIELVFMNSSGRFMARVEGKTKGNVLLRREQYRIADNVEKSLDIAKSIISAKVFNARANVERTLRDHKLRIDSVKFEEKSNFLKNSVHSAFNAKSADELRGIEGEAASVYFSLFDDMILQQKDSFSFKRRVKRPPTDMVNALLSFTYSITVGMCTSSLEAVGLDPYVGFLHTDRPGRCSLALDLVEELRASLCDKFVLMLINKKVISENDFETHENGAVALTDDGRRTFFQAWQQRKSDIITHPFLKEKVEWGMVPYVQALLLARYIRGDLDCYPALIWK